MPGVQSRHSSDVGNETAKPSYEGTKGLPQKLSLLENNGLKRSFVLERLPCRGNGTFRGV